jgi:penicillin-binding protein 1C
MYIIKSWGRRFVLHPLVLYRRLPRRRIVIPLAAVAAAVAVWLALPVGSLFPDSYSTLVFDSKGRLLRATLASDEQFRFPPGGIPLPEKYVTALVLGEDKRFYLHPGVDPLALVNAAYTNIKTGSRIRGGSTITMQVARLANPKPRTYWNKLIECLVAVRLSLHYSKEEILELYARNAPMGGNIVGIEAASHFYFEKPAGELTWAEASLLVVLPNNPSMINLERERPRLVRKRNELIERLFNAGIIDSLTRELACAEPLPGRDRRLPFTAPHFTTMVLGREREHRNAVKGAHRRARDYRNAVKGAHRRTRDSRNITQGETGRSHDAQRIITTLDSDIQHRVLEAARAHNKILADHGIENLAVLVVETGSGKIRAYVGSHDFYDSEHGGQIDGVMAYRSTGSLLKPFLIAKVLDRGPYTITSRLQDVPTYYGTFMPQNASKDFSGFVSIDRVLIESLNVPAVRLLNAYGLGDFFDFLVESGLEGLFRAPMRYGLPLVMGGAEANLFELVTLYLSLGNLGEQKAISVVSDDRDEQRQGYGLFSAGAAWLVLDVLSRLSRPGVEFYWDRFDNHVPVAWKTGTSYGQKDAWAVGVNRQWTIGVWTGNFTGEGNAALGGARSAAPLLFTLFNMLARRDREMWFEEPHHDLKDVVCCAASGYPAGPYCPETITVKCPRRMRCSGSCPYHKRYLVDAVTGRSVCSLCWNGIETEWDTLFVAPPAVKEILVKNGRCVDAVPPHAAHCATVRDGARLDLVYPVDGIKIFVPRDFDGEHERIVFSAKHQRPSEHLFWYLNGSLIGETVEYHELSVELDAGSYRLTVQDEEGFTRSISFDAYKKGA